jgi:hypothetical protein
MVEVQLAVITAFIHTVLQLKTLPNKHEIESRTEFVVTCSLTASPLSSIQNCLFIKNMHTTDNEISVCRPQGLGQSV